MAGLFRHRLISTCSCIEKAYSAQTAALPSLYLTVNCFPCTRCSTCALLHIQSLPQKSLDGTLTSKVKAGQGKWSDRRKSAAWCLHVCSMREGRLLLRGGRVSAPLGQLNWTVISYLYSPSSFTWNLFTLFFQFPNLKIMQYLWCFTAKAAVY